LGRAYASILAQADPLWEILVVDDGSSDNTRDVTAGFMDPRVRYIYQTNQGLSTARNTGIAAAAGRFICFLDADDEWEPEFLEKTVAALEDNTDLGGVYVLSRFISESGDYLPEGGSLAIPDEQFHERLFDGCFLPVHSALLRREAVVATGGFDTGLTSVEDWDFWIRLSATWRMKAIAESLVRYRVVGGSMSMDASQMLQNRMRVLTKHLGAPTGDPATWNAQKRRAYARAFLAAAIEYGNSVQGIEESWGYLAKAARLDPAVLDSVATFFSMAVAKQPKGYRGTALFINPEQVEGELLTGVLRLFSGNDPLPAQWEPIASCSAHLALWTLNDRIGEWGRARRHLLAVGRIRPLLFRDVRYWRTLLRLTVGPQSTEALRRARSSLRHSRELK
jgi:glycosyltransferase involved in cell wall biosynthesis